MAPGLKLALVIAAAASAPTAAFYSPDSLMSGDACFHKSRIVDCHYSGGAHTMYETDPAGYFHNSAPSIVFVTRNRHELITIVSSCEIHCPL